MNLNASSRFRIVSGTSILYFLVIAGFIVRLILLFFAENRLDADEATVGIMALDILEGKAFPFFFYENTYNGGGALEAYLGAVTFKLFGPSEIALKFALLMLWTLSALFFVDLCRKNLDGHKAFFSLLFFSVGTPFFLEWGLKARGGYAETVLFSVVLLWLAGLPRGGERKRSLRFVSFGIVCGIGMWTSEMLLAMIFCSTIWLFLRMEKAERLHATVMLLLGWGIGLIPLALFNVTHNFDHLKATVVYNKLIMRGGAGSSSHSLSQLMLSASFVLGKAWILIILGIVAGVWKLIRTRLSLNLGHVVALHTVLYSVAYWFSGVRGLPIPPSRTLYALYPGIAILLSYSFDVFPSGGKLKKALSIGAISVWLIVTSSSVVQWISSGVPRETGSWRGSWSLTDGEGIYNKLKDLGVQEAYNTYWTKNSLLFAARNAQHINPNITPMSSYYYISEAPEAPVRQVAVVLHTNGKLIKDIEAFLKAKNMPYQRSEFKDFTILSGFDSLQINRNTGLPGITNADWEPLPSKPDGFN